MDIVLNPCVACGREFRDLESHLKRNNICNQWTELVKNDDRFAKKIQDVLNEETPIRTTCDACGRSYTNIGNLNKHLKTNPECIKLKEYKKYSLDESEHKQMKSLINFVIWNLYLTDREVLRHKGIADNIHHIVYIFPDKTKVDLIEDKEYTIIDYNNDHTQRINLSEFRKIFDIMDSLQKERKNVLIVCYSGFQRSVPFLCRYLLERHSNEVRNLEEAMGIVLSSIHKYSEIKTYTDKYNELEWI